MNVKIQKKFTNYPFAHRQWKDTGHCRNIHGHNWDFILGLSGLESQLDDRGFLFDFGCFAPLRQWLESTFDHTLCLSPDDPLLPLLTRELNNIRILKYGVSCEQIAKLVAERTIELIPDIGNLLTYVEVAENKNNSATYYVKRV